MYIIIKGDIIFMISPLFVLKLETRNEKLATSNMGYCVGFGS